MLLSRCFQTVIRVVPTDYMCHMTTNVTDGWTVRTPRPTRLVVHVTGPRTSCVRTRGVSITPMFVMVCATANLSVMTKVIVVSIGNGLIYYIVLYNEAQY